MLDSTKEDIRRIESDFIKENGYGIAHYSQYEEYYQASTINIYTKSGKYTLYSTQSNTGIEQVICTFELQLNPYPHYEVTFQSTHPVLSHVKYEITNDYARLSFRLKSPVANAQNQYSGIILSSKIDKTTEFNSVRFHLVNFPRIANQNIVYYKPEDLRSRAFACSRLYIEFGDYELSIDGVLGNIFELNSTFESKKLTHYANISCKDKRLIIPDELEIIRSTSYLLISFLAGYWCPSILSELFINEKTLDILLVPEESSLIGPYFVWTEELMYSTKHEHLDVSPIAQKIYTLVKEQHITKVLPLLMRWYFDCISQYVAFETCIMSCVSLLETIYKRETHYDMNSQITKSEGYIKVYPFFNDRDIEHRIPHLWQDVKDFHTKFVGIENTTEQSILPLLRKIRNKLHHHEINDLDIVYSTHPTTRFRLTLLAQQLAEETLLRYLGYTGKCAKRDGLQTHMYG